MGEKSLTPDSWVVIVLRSIEGWEQVAAFVALTLHHKMDLAGYPTTNGGSNHPPHVFAASYPAIKEKDDLAWPSTSESSL